MATSGTERGEGIPIPEEMRRGPASEGSAPQRPVAEDRRRALVHAGERLVASGGLGALTARRLAAEAGVSLGAAYHLFEDLEALAVAVNARTFDRLGAALRGVPRHGEPEADLIALAEAYIAFVAANPKLWGAVFELPIRDGGIGHRGGTGRDGPNGARVEALLASLDDAFSPVLPDDPVAARASARVLWGAVHGLVSLSATGRMGVVGIDDLSGAVRHLVRCHLAGLDRIGRAP